MIVGVVHQASLAGPTNGGIDSFIRDVFEQDIEGVDWHLFGAQRNGEPPSFDARETVVARLPPRRQLVPDSLRMALGLCRLRRRLNHCSEIHCHRIEYVPIIRSLAPQARIRLFIHTPTSESLGTHSDSLWRLLRPLNRAVERLALRLTREIYCFSRTEANRLEEFGYRVSRLGGTFDGRLFTPISDREGRAPTIVWVGRFEAPKDPALAAAVLTEFTVGPGKGFDAVMIGDGSLREEVSDAYPTVRIVAPQSRTEIAATIRTASAVLVTSHYEAAPRIIVEALACKTPVVAVSSADPERLVHQTGLGFCTESRSVAELVQALDLVTSTGIRVDAAQWRSAMRGREFARCLRQILEIDTDGEFA